jgi:hypothetical protein
MKDLRKTLCGFSDSANNQSASFAPKSCSNHSLAPHVNENVFLFGGSMIKLGKKK